MAQNTQQTGGKKPSAGDRNSPKKDGIINLLSEQNKEANAVFKNDGSIDARAFKKIIFERQAGSMNGPKNSLAASVNNVQKSEYLEDNILLHGLKSFGITIDQLLEANLKNIDPNANNPVKPRFQNQEDFEQHVQKNLQSPVVRSLKAITDIIKPKSFGMNRKMTQRHKSLPANRGNTKMSGQSGSGSKASMPLTNRQDNQHSLETVNEENIQQKTDPTTSQADEPQPISTLDGTRVPFSGLQSVPEINEQESEHKKSIKNFGQQANNHSVPRLQASNPMGGLTFSTGSKIKSKNAGQSFQSPMMSQMAMHNRSGSLKDENSLDEHIGNLQQELDQNFDQSDRYSKKSPFMNAKSDYNIQMQHQPSNMIMVPIPVNSDPTINDEDYYDVYKNMIKKYQRRPRDGKELSMDPEELNVLDDRGYKIKAERYQRKRHQKKQMKRQRSQMTGERIAVRGDNDYVSSTSSSASSHSSVSYGGVPEADLEYLQDQIKQDEINGRRNVRRADKWQIIFDQVVSYEVKNEISAAITSQEANYEASDTDQMLAPPSEIQLISDDQTDFSPRTKARHFSEAQAQMKGIMDSMAGRLKGRFLEDIDEEVPEEYLIQKEQESIQNQTGTSFSQEGHLMQDDPLEQIEASIQNMMEGLVQDIRKDGSFEDQQKAEKVMISQQQSTKPSSICNQASYIGARKVLSQRMNKFNRTVNTSPRFYDNLQEQNNWTVKMGTLDKGKIEQIFPNNERVESFQKLAKHLKSQNLTIIQQATEVPKGFNNNMPLDSIMLELGNHMHKRSETLKTKHKESQNAPFNQTTKNMTSSPIFTSSNQLQNSEQQQNYNVSSSVFGQSPSAQSYGFGTQGNISPNNTLPQNNSRRNSDQLLQDVNAVFQFLAQANNNGGNKSMKSLNQAFEDQQNELKDCMIVERTGSKAQNTSSSKSLFGQQTSPICHCSHMAPHRHIYLNPSHSTKNFLASDLPNSQLIVSSGEQIGMLENLPPTAHLKTKQEQDTIEALAQLPDSSSPEKAVLFKNMYDGSQISSSGQVTPLLIQKPPMTDRNWNNSELKKFSVNQSKSNADIQQELSRFKIGDSNDLDNNEDVQFNDKKNNGTTVMVESESHLDEEINDDQHHMTGLSNKKGKTFTVLFKPTDKLKDKSIESARSNHKLESPGMHRDASKDEYLKPGMVESARYDLKDDQRNKDVKKLSPTAATRVHKINILQNLNSNETKEVGLSSHHNMRLSARQQLLSVSVKNIELPDQYKVSQQQMPSPTTPINRINEVISPLSTQQQSALESRVAKKHEIIEVGLQTTIEQNQTNHSFFQSPSKLLNADEHQQQPIIVIQSQMEKYPEIMASQPTIGTDSRDKLGSSHAGGHPPSPKFVDQATSAANNTKITDNRDGTALRIMSEHYDQSNDIAEMYQGGMATQTIAEVSSPASVIQNNINTQVTTIHNVFKVEGQTKNLHAHGSKATLPTAPKKEKYEIELNKTMENEQQTATGASHIEISKPIYQHKKTHPVMMIDQVGNGSQLNDYETDGGTAYGSRGINSPNRLDPSGVYGGGRMRHHRDNDILNSPLVKRANNNDLNAVADPVTERVVRNFKPSKTKRLPQINLNVEHKLSQLADSNVTPLGLFNQDLHAKREWNKLMETKHFSATLNDRNMSFTDARIQEILIPISPPDANKTTQNLNANQVNETRDDLTCTADNSQERESKSKEAADNSTLQSPESRSGLYKKLYAEPRIHVQNESQKNKKRGLNQQSKQQKLNLQTKVPQARSNSKVIVFNFKGNHDLPENYNAGKRMENQQQNLNVPRMSQLQDNKSSKPLLLSNNSNHGLGNGIFSPKRNSVNHNDSVSIYAKAKAQLNLNNNSSKNLMNIKGQHNNAFDVPELVIKEERSRYKTTIRQRVSIGGGLTSEQRPKQPTSLSTSKFLIGRRNPTINAQMYSQKVSPFKPMGGGFKQNLNIEVSQHRMEQEVAAQRDRISGQKVDSNQSPRQSRNMLQNTLEQALAEQQQQQQNVGFNITQSKLNLKQGKVEILNVNSDDMLGSEKMTKEAQEKSGLSQLNHLLNDFKASDDASSNGARMSQAATPSPPAITRQDIADMKQRGIKSSTEYHVPSPSAQGGHRFNVPNVAMTPKPLKDAIQTNDSFGKIVNMPNQKKSHIEKIQSQTKATFSRKKESTSIPYPIKSGVVGETLQASSPNTSKGFNSSNGPQDVTYHGNVSGGSGHNSNSNSNSPRMLEGTRMKLTQKSKDNRSSPFEKESESPRKQRFSPKTLATIKGGTKENPIMIESNMTNSKKKILQRNLAENDGIDSNMRTESRGLSHQNPQSSRPDLFKTRIDSSGQDGTNNQIFIDREYSHEQLNSDHSKTRQVVGLLTRNEPNSSMMIAASRDDLVRDALSAQRSSNLAMYKLEDIHSKLQNLDNHVDADLALRDNPGQLQEIHMDAKRQLTDLINQRSLGLQGNYHTDKNHFISTVAQKQLGAGNYRRKAKKSKDGLNPGFEFQNQNTAESLNRILGNNKNARNTKQRNMLTVNMLHPTIESKNESSSIFESKGTDILLHMSTARRDLSLSISNNTKKRRQ